MSADELEGFYDDAQEALGVYIGPATQDEVIDALTRHSGVFVAYLHTEDGGLVWQKFSRRGPLVSGLNEDVKNELVLVFARDLTRGGEQDVAGYRTC